ncbi:MAG: thermonuclease family protein [Phyllobacteriaceae bacterium]|nr:thermonuclease family protein [Phyllobacteriaceae bacterium]
MTFVLLAGSFLPGFGVPDGDSLRFVPDDPNPLFKLKRRASPPKPHPDNGSVQLRYEGIDAIEKGSSSPFAAAAKKRNIDIAMQAGGRGHILTNQLDENGRPIVFAFAGDAKDSGDDIHLDARRLGRSINFQLATEGLVHPLFYDTLYVDLRNALAKATKSARKAGAGLWATDATLAGAPWTGSVAKLPPIFPKLWRRLETYAKDPDYFDPARPLANIARYIKMEHPERVLILSLGKTTGFDNVVEGSATTVRLVHVPEDIVVVSTPTETG